MRTAPATVQRTVRGNIFAATRIIAPPNVSGPLRLPKEAAYIFAVQLSGVRRRDLWVEGKKIDQSELPAGSVSFYDLEAEIESQAHSSFDSLQLYIPRQALADCLGEPGDAGLDLKTGVAIDDHTIKHLAHSMLPTLASPTGRDGAFVEEIALAVMAHIGRAYGNSRPTIIRGGLAPWQYRRAREMLAADLTRDFSLTEIAAECGLSVGHFARGFREGIGESPHRWLIRQRVEKAKQMLADRQGGLAEIALDCGFSDQSHFTRLFRRATGTTPGMWRRIHRG